MFLQLKALLKEDVVLSGSLWRSILFDQDSFFDLFMLLILILSKFDVVKPMLWNFILFRVILSMLTFHWQFLSIVSVLSCVSCVSLVICFYLLILLLIHCADFGCCFSQSVLDDACLVCTTAAILCVKTQISVFIHSTVFISHLSKFKQSMWFVKTEKDSNIHND